MKKKFRQVQTSQKLMKMKDLYEKWCDAAKNDTGRKHYWTYVEKEGGRDLICDDLAKTIRSHYDSLERISEDVNRLGYEKASRILKQRLPQTDKARSGDLGEILATELVEEEIGLSVPVRRLRFKDGREMALRGDDFIGAGFAEGGGGLRLLKGEAKSRNNLAGSVIDDAREVLDRDNGRCTPHSLLFVADRLLESNEPSNQELGRSIRDEVGLNSLPPRRISHMLFTMSGNGPHHSLKTNLDNAGASRDQYAMNLHIADHKDFISKMYQRAERLGDE